MKDRTGAVLTELLLKRIKILFSKQKILVGFVDYQLTNP
jgi:hypothetical protein